MTYPKMVPLGQINNIGVGTGMFGMPDEIPRLLNRYPAPKVPTTAVAPVATPTPVPTAGVSDAWDTSLLARYGVPASNPVAGAYGGLPTDVQNAFMAAPATAVPEAMATGFPNYGMSSEVPAGMGFGSDAPASFLPAYGADTGSTDWMPDWLKGAIGTKDNPGWGGFALGAANSAASMLFGMQQYGLAKDTLNENKRQFQMNYDAQKQTTNTALEDRQRARVASNAGAYESVGSYMDKNGVK